MQPHSLENNWAVVSLVLIGRPDPSSVLHGSPGEDEYICNSVVGKDGKDGVGDVS